MGGASFPVWIERNADMNESNFWANYAEAMELSIEGNRLIAQEIADFARTVWTRAIRSLDEMLRSVGQHQHLPPI
jgi:hypothetical protein